MDIFGVDPKLTKEKAKKATQPKMSRFNFLKRGR
jgi:hypothetical protein